MELWYSEFHTGNVKLSVRINRQLFSGESEFQRIDVFESEEFGRLYSLIKMNLFMMRWLRMCQ